MLTAVVFLPAPPLLVPELAGGAAPAMQDLRTACLDAVASLKDVAGPWTAVAAGGTAMRLDPRSAGSWASFGADVRVSLSPDGGAPEDPQLPLPALILGWLRGRAAPAATIAVQLYPGTASPQECRELGLALAAEPSPAVLLAVGDGCTTLTEKAPGAFDPRATALQQQIDDALAAADTAALERLDPQLCDELGVSGRAPWQVAAAAAGPGWRGRSLHRSAPYGVGYHVAVWRR